MFSKPAEVQGRAKFSLGSQREPEGSDNLAFVFGATAAVLLRFGSPNKNITLRKNEE